MVVDGKNKVMHSSSKTYYTPFSWMPIMEQFDYQSATSMSYLGSGTAYLAKDGSSYDVPTTERFYGEYLDYVPGLKNNEKVMIKMKRASFGAKFIAKGKLADLVFCDHMMNVSRVMMAGKTVHEA